MPTIWRCSKERAPRFEITSTDSEGPLTVYYEVDAASTVQPADYTPQLTGIASFSDGVTLVYENSGGMTFSVPAQYVTAVLNVWRTLHVERASMTAPRPGDGPFNGDLARGS